MSSKRTKPKKDAPITGVASGSLGTGTNLDETQVIRIADLKAAAPTWLDDDAPDPAMHSDVIPPEDLALLGASKAMPPRAPAAAGPAVDAGRTAATPVVATPVVATPVQPRPAIQPRPPEEGRPTTNRRVPALAGFAAFLVLVFVAGVGLSSQLDLSSLGASETFQPGIPTFEAAVEASPAATLEPLAAKGHGKCKGKGHGNGCD